MGFRKARNQPCSQPAPAGSGHDNVLCDDRIGETARYYRDLLTKLLAYGLTVTLLITGWLIGANADDELSLSNPYEVAEKAATESGAPRDSRQYNQVYRQAFCAAQMKYDRAVGFVGLSVPGWLIWLLSVIIVRRKCREHYHRTVPSWGVTLLYSLLILSAQVFILFLVFKD